MDKKRFAAWLLVAVMMLSLVPSAFGEGTYAPDTRQKPAEVTLEDDLNGTGRIHISTVEDLKELARNCQLDSYSVGITVILDNDIDLQGEPFTPIPTFSGTFEGNGNSITNFVNAEEGSNEGLFRYVEETGEIRNLKVTGQTVAQEGGLEIGGIVGTNYGLIEACQFSGTVFGREQVGGICGANYGMVVNCISKGTVSGKTMVGGICGYNNGAIYSCRNRATVNPTVWEGEDDDTSDLSAMNLTNLAQVDVVSLISANSSDTTTDVGGIVGYSDHIVYVCINRGDVGYPHYGYNVGGIAGRQSNFISKCTNYGSVSGRNDVGGIVGQNEPYMDLTDRMTMAGEIQALSDNFENTTGTFSEDSDANAAIISDIGTDTQNTFEATQDALNDTGKMDDLEEDVEEDFGVKTEMNDLDNVTVVQDEEEEEEEPGVVDKFLDRTKDVSSTVDKDYIDGVYEDAQNAEKGDAWDVTKKAIDNSGLDKSSEEEKTSDKTSDAAGSARDKAEELVGKDTTDRVISGDLTDDDISKIAEVGAEKGSEKLSEDADTISAKRAARKAAEAAEQDALVEDITTGGNAVVSLGNNFSALGQSLRETMTNLTDNLEVVNEHFTNIMNMLADALAGNFNMDIMQDISELNDTDSMYGTVTNSKNYGTVDGDESVGGIAGSMSIESDLDLEGVISDNLASNGLFSNTYETTCIIRACENEGTVTAKHDNNGGIVGKQDMGLIINSENYGDVTGTGSYTGGVVGLSYSTVNTCYSKCTITGADYVGGIAGSGTVLYDCISLSTIGDTEGSFVGAIAGYADMEAEREVELDSGISSEAVNLVSGTTDGETEGYTFVTENCVTGNYFVSEGLGGVNGISYTDLAEPVTYKEAMEFSGLPSALNCWVITFRADGETVAEVEFVYGESLTTLPEVPAKEGYTGFWEDFQTENLTASRTVDAVYIRNGNTVEGSWLRADTGVCAVLLEGPVDDRTGVNVSLITPADGARVDGKELLETVTVSLTDAAAESAEYTIHYQPPQSAGSTPDIYVLDAYGMWQQVEVEEQGSYLLFSSKAPVTFAVTVHSNTLRNVLLGTTLLLLAAGAILLYVHRRSARRIHSRFNRRKRSARGDF